MNIPAFNYEAILNQLPLLCCSLDKHSNVTWMNQYALDSFNFNHIEEVIGRNHYAQPWNEYADLFTQQDKLSLAGHVQSTIDKTVKMNGKRTILLVSKAPFLNNNSIEGVIATGFELTKENYKNIIFYLSTKNLNLSDFVTSENKKSEFTYKNVEFTKRQAEILGYLLRGNTAETTAKILSRSPRTIEKHIEQIRDKLECTTRTEIIEKSFDYGFIDLMFIQM